MINACCGLQPGCNLLRQILTSSASEFLDIYSAFSSPFPRKPAVCHDAFLTAAAGFVAPWRRSGSVFSAVNITDNNNLLHAMTAELAQRLEYRIPNCLCR
jgi:hypothetical protein